MPRDDASVSDRAAVVRGLAASSPDLSRAEIAARLKISIGAVKHYLSPRMKAPRLRSEWSAVLFAACCSLAWNDRVAAAQKFRELAGKLETP